MTTQYWLVKQEPDSYAWTDFVRDGRTAWEGVRNFQARNFLKAMRSGDAVLFYASGKPKAVQGLARVARAAYPDPTADEGDWVAVDLEPVRPLSRPVTLEEMKKDPQFSDFLLVRHSRLSVVPATKEQYLRILELAGDRAAKPVR